MKIVAETPTSRVIVILYGTLTDERIQEETLIAEWRAKQLS